MMQLQNEKSRLPYDSRLVVWTKRLLRFLLLFHLLGRGGSRGRGGGAVAAGADADHEQTKYGDEQKFLHGIRSFRDNGE